MKTSILQVYAFLVCFVAVIISIVCLWTTLGSSLDLLTPEYKNYSQLSSFHSNESYKLSKHDSKELAGKSSNEITEMRKNAKALALENIKGRAIESIIHYILGLMIAIPFFFIHWKIAMKEKKGQ